MKITRLNSRNIVFSFPELNQTNIFAIYGDTYTYLCDTFLGPEPMELVKETFIKDGRDQPVIVFNSHYDWDHVWGNCAFTYSTIIAHQKCYDNLGKYFWDDLNENFVHMMGEVVPWSPNLLFQERLEFIEDDVIFFHSPGHTNDSSSCYDKKTNTIYVGDNVENPHPIIQNDNIDLFIDTLHSYIKLDPRHIITGHGEMGSLELIKSNIDYLKEMRIQDK